MEQNSKDLRDVNISEERRNEIEKIIEENFSGFKENEKKEIFLGLLHELTLLQVALYANRNLNAQQMQEIRLCFEHGLTLKQIFLLFKCYRDFGREGQSFTAEQMHEIRLMHEKGMPFRLVSSVTQFNSSGKPSFDAKQMHEIRLMYDSMSLEQISLYTKCTNAGEPIFTAEQMLEIRLMCEIRFMSEIRLMYKDGIPQEQIPSYIIDEARTILDTNLMHEICLMYEDGMPQVQISSYIKFNDNGYPIFNAQQMHEIGLGHKHGLTSGQISVYAQDWCDSHLMQVARLILEEENSRNRK